MLEKIKTNFTKYFSNGPKATFLLALVLISLIATIYTMRKTVTVIIDGEEKSIVTYKRTVQGALRDNGISVEEKDKVEPQLDSNVRKGDIIKVKKAVNVEVAVDGKQLQVKTAEENVENMLSAEGIKLKEDDKISPSLESKIADGLKVGIVRVEVQNLTENKPIEFATVIQKDNNMANTETKTLQAGEQGQKEITTKIVYEDGKEVERKVVGEKVVKEPVNKVLLQGTLGVLNLSRGSGGNPLYTSAMKVKATAYYNSGSNGNHITATGARTVRNQNGYSTIAVDPRVIPLGTKVFVDGYGYAIAADTGGAIKGDKIDLFMDSRDEAYDWGVRYVTIYILK